MFWDLRCEEAKEGGDVSVIYRLASASGISDL